MFTQSSGEFHWVTADASGIATSANKATFRKNETLNITSSVHTCALVTSDRFSSAVVVV